MTLARHRNKVFLGLVFACAIYIFQSSTFFREPVQAAHLGATVTTNKGQIAGTGHLAVSQTGSISIIKQAEPSDGTDFPFIIDGLEKPPFLLTWGNAGDDAGEFMSSSGVAVDGAGNVYVADLGNHRVQKFSAAGAFISTWGWGVDTGAAAFEICTPDSLPCQTGSFGGGDGQFIAPNEVAVDEAGHVYVIDVGNSRIQKFDTNGNFLLSWGSLGFDDGQFYNPNGITVDTGGNVYVADTSNNRIQKFDSTGNHLLSWGSSGSGNGAFSSPTGVAVDMAGDVYVADWGNDRIQKFDAGGTFIIAWGSQGNAESQFSAPTGVSVDGAGFVYVADTDNHRIQKFYSDGSFHSAWGSLGSGEGQFNDPEDVVTDAAGNIFVADTDNNRIQKFANNSHFSLDDATPDDGDALNNTINFSDIPVGTYTITELIPEDWDINSISCQSDDNSDTPTINPDSVTIALTLGESITCTFENIQLAAPVLSISQNNDDAILVWDPVLYATGYNVYRSTTPYLSPDIPYNDNATSPFPDAGIAAQATPFYYRVSATGSDNAESLPSNEVGLFTFALVPGNG